MTATKNLVGFIVFYQMIISVVTAQVTFSTQNNLIHNIGGTSVADCAADMDGDGLDDIVRVMGDGIHIDYQQPNGTFTHQFYPMAIQTSPSWSIVAADIDGNGYTDLCFGGGSRVSFVYANDTGTGFTEVQHPEYIFSQRTTFADIDNDGNLDAFACHDVDESHPYRNVDGLLQLDPTLIETVPVGGNYSAIWIDYDNDRDIDLYMTKCRGGAPYNDNQRVNRLYRNNGDGTYTEVSAQANMNDSNQSWSTAFEDFDNDGDMDAFIANHASSDVPGGAANRLMRNNGDGTFTNIITGSGISASQLGAWNCDAADFDNNGFVDIFSEMSTEMYWNQGQAVFTGQDLSFDSGGIGDFNNDGFLDVIAGNNVWINNGNANNYVKFKLEGIISNRSAVGARVEITGDFGVQIREVRAGRSFDPASSLTIHFGLGTSTTIDQVAVYWPSGMVTVMDNPAINQQHLLLEATCLNPPVQIDVQGSVEICPGESVVLTAPQGASYLWSNGATSQSITVSQAANYSVVVWNEEDCASLSNVIPVTIIQTETPVLTVEGQGITCAGDAITIASSNAQSYLWSNGATSPSIEVTETGDYFVNITGICSGQSLQSDPVHIEILENPLPVAQDVIIGEPGTAELTASGNNLEWFASETSTEVLGTGNTFVTPYFTEQTSFWVQATTNHPGQQMSGGYTNMSNGGLPSTGGRLIFDATEPFVLEQATILVPATSTAGYRNFQLFNSEGELIQSVSVYCEVGTQTIDLNLEIPAGTNMEIGCAENNLFRSSGVAGYPFAIGDVGSIHGSTFGTSYYYYLYDWRIRKGSMQCVSPRVEVNAMVVNIDEIQNPLGLSAYPNPVKENLVLRSKNTIAGARVYIVDLSGRVVSSQNLTEGNLNSLSVIHLASGMYHAVVIHQGKQSAIEFVKQ